METQGGWNHRIEGEIDDFYRCQGRTIHDGPQPNPAAIHGPDMGGRVMGKPAKRARSKSWPVSCFDKVQRGYVLAQEGVSNVTKLPVRKRKP